jgi:hypothetical protein
MALQEYIPTQWVDNAAPAIDSINLNHIELGIKDVTDTVITFDDELTQLRQEVDALQITVGDMEQDIIQLRTDVDNLINNPYTLPDATATVKGGVRVDVQGTTGYIWTSDS